MIDAQSVRTIVQRSMQPKLYNQSGGLMLSGIDALKPGFAYIMGLNPGGDPEAPGHERSILESVHEHRNFSCYADECWQRRCTGPAGACEHVSDGRVLPQFLVKHQRNMIALAAALGAAPQEIFSANAIFGRSTSRATLEEQTGFSMAEWWDACWPVHQEFLSIVRPRVIISLGYGMNSSAFGLLWPKAGSPPYQRVGDESRRGGWSFPAHCQLADGEFETMVIGVPHPSYMEIGPQLAQSLASLAAAGVA